MRLSLVEAIEREKGAPIDEVMLRWWASEVASGHDPTYQGLADYLGCSYQGARRWVSRYGLRLAPMLVRRA